MPIKKTVASLFFLLFAFAAFAQQDTTKIYPAGYNRELDENKAMLLDAELELNEALLAGVRASLDTLGPEVKTNLAGKDTIEKLKIMRKEREQKEMRSYLQYMRDSLTGNVQKIKTERKTIEARLNPTTVQNPAPVVEKTTPKPSVPAETISAKDLAEAKKKKEKEEEEAKALAAKKDAERLKAEQARNKFVADSILTASKLKAKADEEAKELAAKKEAERIKAEQASAKHKADSLLAASKVKPAEKPMAKADTISAKDLAALKKKKEKEEEEAKALAAKTQLELQKLKEANAKRLSDSLNTATKLKAKADEEAKELAAKKKEEQSKSDKANAKHRADSLAVANKLKTKAEEQARELAAKQEEERLKTEKAKNKLKADSLALASKNKSKKQAEPVAETTIKSAEFPADKISSKPFVDSATFAANSKTAPAPKIKVVVDSATRIKSNYYLTLAQRAMVEKDLHKALENLGASTSLWNANYDAWFTMAGIHSDLGEHQKALEDYEQCYWIDSGKAKLFLNRATVYQQLGNKGEALRNLNKSIQLDPNYIAAYMKRGSVYNDTAMYDAAIADYDQVFRINKSYYQAYKARGYSKLMKRSFTQAMDDFTRYIIFDQTDPQVYYYRGLAKIGNSEWLDGCLELSMSANMGYSAAATAMKKNCE